MLNIPVTPHIVRDPPTDPILVVTPAGLTNIPDPITFPMMIAEIKISIFSIQLTMDIIVHNNSRQLFYLHILTVTNQKQR